MDHRPPLGQQRPRLPQRAVSGGAYVLSHQAPKRATLPSRLTNVRSVSQPASAFLDSTSEGTKRARSNSAAFLGNKETLVRSPEAIKVDDDDAEPPAKKAKTTGEEFRAEWEEVVGDGKDAAYESVPGSPLPGLPKPKPETKRIAGHRRHRLGIGPAARKAHGLDPPASAARVPPPKKVADFLPWTGNHPEDVLSETVIKGGYFDKVQGTNQAESNSAKASLWPQLSQRNHHGLSLLGHLFTAVMEKRQAIGKCTAPSTFKPPPRVTVTDTKREAWLRDLANAEVPLRKQSRTIPHGIRGRLLMEQCLTKVVPLQRAVWLAKCVGANELRAFRRKGVSGSAAASGEWKWVREWTVHVEQFLEGVVATCGQQGWQSSMSYAVKLATAFYSEKLLDADHYLDWIVASMSGATLDRLPVWIVIAQIYWKEITMYGRRGRKLAETILDHLHRITETKLDVNAAVKTRLRNLVAVLSVSNRGCLLIPRLWEKYKYLLTPKAGHAAEQSAATNIARRNERLAKPLCKSTLSPRSPLLELYTELDSTALDVDIDQLSEKCLTLIPDISKLLAALLDWASTPFRTGIARVFVAARIFARLQDFGHDTDATILQYLGSSRTRSPSAIANIHRVIVELVRLEAFSVGRYLQWLITSGALSASDEPTCATNLLTALPAKGLSVHIRNTRRMLMRRLGYPFDETEVIDGVLRGFDHAVARSSTEYVNLIDSPHTMTPSAKFDVSQQICAKLTSTAKGFAPGLGAFSVARDIIEGVGDISSLAALVIVTIASEDTALLATVSDTVNLHAETFAALGEFRRLVDGLSEQYLALRSQQPLDRTFILALTSLAERIPEKAVFVKILTEDLIICEQQNSVAVCSPASDSLIGMHASSLDSDEDIDAVFASGNTMDEQLMQRVFMRIIQRTRKPQPPGPEPVSRIGGWLHQLRSVDSSGVFDKLVHNYLWTLLKSATDAPVSLDAISNLVSSGCVPLGKIADMTIDVKSPSVASVMLPMFIATHYVSTGLHEFEKNHYRLQQERCQVEHTDSLIRIVRTAFETPDFAVDDPDLIQFIIRCVTGRPGSVRRVFEDGTPSDTLVRNVKGLFTAIVQREGLRDSKPNELDIPTLVNAANPLSIQFCVGTLRYFKSAPDFNCEDEGKLADALLQSFIDNSEVWPELLACAGDIGSRKIHEWAQDQLLDMAMSRSGGGNESGYELMKRYLDLLAATSNFANKSDDTAKATTITDKLKELEKQLSDLGNVDAELQIETEGYLYQLRIMLHLCVMHVHSSPNENESVTQAKGNLLAALCTLLVHPRLQTCLDLLEYIYDLASTLSDDLPDAALIMAKSQAASRPPVDARLTSILGNNSSTLDSWLALASHVHPPGSQQQRALSKHASQQGQMNGRPSTPGQPQQSSQQQHQRWPSGGGLSFFRQDSKNPVEMKTTPFSLRRWEIMSDPTPVMGENDTSLSLGLFGARKV